MAQPFDDPLRELDHPVAWAPVATCPPLDLGVTGEITKSRRVTDDLDASMDDVNAAPSSTSADCGAIAFGDGSVAGR
jgi:hypothetical protein